MEPMGNCPFCGADGVGMEHVSDCADHDADINPPQKTLSIQIVKSEVKTAQVNQTRFWIIFLLGLSMLTVATIILSPMVSVPLNVSIWGIGAVKLNVVLRILGWILGIIGSFMVIYKV